MDCCRTTIVVIIFVNKSAFIIVEADNSYILAPILLIRLLWNIF